MKSLSKPDLAVLHHLVTGVKEVYMTKRDLLDLVFEDDLANKDFQTYLHYTSDPPALRAFEEDALRHLLQMRCKKTFPFNLSIFTGNKIILRKTLFWWFETCTGTDPNTIKIFNPENLNESQRKLQTNTVTLALPRKTLLQIVNAGPGTGKTTAANALAYSLREEGVLLISYTNESIRENYKRFFEYPDGKYVSGLKKYSGVLINLVTVDSLATKVTGDASDNNFDRLVQMASINIDPFKFIHPTRKRVYNHIVVDECQDIDDLRGNFILTFCKKIGIKTLTLFGDPRQKIRGNAGTWYSELWENTFNYTKNGHKSEMFEPTIRVGFDQSYRFVSHKIIDLVNSLSEKRPSLHVELRTGLPESSMIIPPVNVDDPDTNLRISFPIEIIPIGALFDREYLSKLIQGTGSTCIIGPSIEADNNTSNIGRMITSAFRDIGQKISFRTDGAFVPDAIPLLTIHSVKGREFDTVFIFGMSNYPNNFSMIPQEEALSLIFVSHSRAKRKIYYIDASQNGVFMLPLHVNRDFVNMNTFNGCIENSYSDFDKINSAKMRHFDVCSLVEDHSFVRFIEENRYVIKNDESPHILPDWKSTPRPYEVSPKSWGFIMGFDYGSQLTSYMKMFSHYFKQILDGEYIIISRDEIVKLTLEGLIINNTKDGKRVLSKDISPTDKVLLQDLLKDVKANAKVRHGEILYLYEKYLERDNIYMDLEKYIEIFSETPDNLVSGDTLRNILKGGEVEVSLSDNDFKVLHGRIDYIDKNLNVYEMKSTTASSKDFTTLLQTWLYHVMNSEEESFAYIIDLQNGRLCEISSNESIHRWRYLLRCYFILRHHVDLTTARRNYLMAYGTLEQKEMVNTVDIKENFFTCDTEFHGSNDIFEIALINVRDPYRTIVDLLLPSSLEGMIFALEWLPHTVSEMYKSKMDKVRLSFNLSVGKFKDPPVISYYICGVDVGWCKHPDLKKLDLSNEARRISESHGTFTGGSMGPKLGELYTALAPFPLEYQSHLQAHTALSDALMLYELIKLGILRV